MSNKNIYIVTSEGATFMASELDNAPQGVYLNVFGIDSASMLITEDRVILVTGFGVKYTDDFIEEVFDGVYGFEYMTCDIHPMDHLKGKFPSKF